MPKPKANVLILFLLAYSALRASSAAAQTGEAAQPGWPQTAGEPDRYPVRERTPGGYRQIAPATYQTDFSPASAAASRQPNGLAVPADLGKPPKTTHAAAADALGKSLSRRPTGPNSATKAGDVQGQGNFTAGRMPSMVTMIGSTGAVLSLFFVVAWLMKRGMPRSMQALPVEVVQVLGRSLLSKGQHVHLVRCGGKLLLVAVSPAGAETLTEITDPAEVDRLTSLCGQDAPRGAAPATFRQALAQFGREGTEPAHVGSSMKSSRGASSFSRGSRSAGGEAHDG